MPLVRKPGRKTVFDVSSKLLKRLKDYDPYFLYMPADGPPEVVELYINPVQDNIPEEDDNPA